MPDPATSTPWAGKVDLAAKLLLPIALFAGSALISFAQQNDAKLRACVDQQFRLAEFACRDSECRAKTEGAADQLLGLTKSAQALCARAGHPLSDTTSGDVVVSVASANSVEQTAIAATAVGEPAWYPDPRRLL